MNLPNSVKSIIKTSEVVAFSGSRGSEIAEALYQAINVITFAGKFAPPVLVGDARGVDATVASLIPSATVFKASDFGYGRGSFAARSIAVIKETKKMGGSRGVWIAFPANMCPPGLLISCSPSKCFSGSGSGTWASLALATGLNIPSLVFGIEPPTSWGFSELEPGSGWFYRGSESNQLSLF
jgi:hypothetical protein